MRGEKSGDNKIEDIYIFLLLCTISTWTPEQKREPFISAVCKVHGFKATTTPFSSL